MLLYKKKKYPYIKYNILKKFFFNRKPKSLQFFKLSCYIFPFFQFVSIYLYNGKLLKIFNFKKEKIFFLIGTFITTRIVNFGKILHKRKKK